MELSKQSELQDELYTALGLDLWRRVWNSGGRLYACILSCYEYDLKYMLKEVE